MGMMRDLSDPRGPWRVWNDMAARSGEPEAVGALCAVEHAFDERIASGGRAVSISTDGQIARLDHFDPAADLIVFIPRLSAPRAEVERPSSGDAASSDAASSSLPWASLAPELFEPPVEVVLRRFALSQRERVELDKSRFLTVRSPTMPERRLFVPLDGPFIWVVENGRPVRLLEVRLEHEFARIDVAIMLKLAILAFEEHVLVQAKSYSFSAASPAILRELYKLVHAPDLPTRYAEQAESAPGTRMVQNDGTF